MFPRYLWQSEWEKYKSPVLRSMTIIGYMQSGKSTMIRYLAYLMHRDLTARGYDDSEIAYIEASNLQRAKEELPGTLDVDRIRYMFVFVDDAINAAHSRRHNVEETKLFSNVRHWAMQRGVLITVYATQDFRLLDRLMRNAMVYAWKTLPFEWWVSTERDARNKILAWIGDHDIVDLLEAITRAIYSNDADKSLAALQTAVVRIPVQNWGPRPIRGIKPLEPPRSITYRLESESESVKDCISISDARMLATGIVKLAGVNNVRLRVNREKYLVGTIRENSEKREFSLGPIVPLLEQLGIDWRLPSSS